jgi:hypothetical protein
MPPMLLTPPQPPPPAAAIAAADTAMVPAAPFGSGIGTGCSYAAAVADGTAVAVVATSVNAAAVASPSSVVTRSSKKPTLSALPAFWLPWLIAEVTLLHQR